MCDVCFFLRLSTEHDQFARVCQGRTGHPRVCVVVSQVHCHHPRHGRQSRRQVCCRRVRTVRLGDTRARLGRTHVPTVLEVSSLQAPGRRSASSARWVCSAVNLEVEAATSVHLDITHLWALGCVRPVRLVSRTTTMIQLLCALPALAGSTRLSEPTRMRRQVSSAA